MDIGGFQKFSVIDYPKKISCIIFLKGCNFRCPYCYNKQLVLPELLDTQPTIPQTEVFEFLEKRRKLIDGVVITGGEPTIHGQDLIDFIKNIKEKDYLIKLDTNGSNPKILKKLLDAQLLDYVAMDVKQVFEKYDLFTKTSIDDIKESLNILKNSSVDREFRITTHPQLTINDFNNILKELKNEKTFVQDFVNTNTIGDFANNSTIFNKLDKNNSQYVLR
jgi:pyruvate formate lyase activating enzyme